MLHHDYESFSVFIIDLFHFTQYRFANALVYYGVSYGSVDLGGNTYVNVFLISVVEIPSNFAIIWALNK